MKMPLFLTAAAAIAFASAAAGVVAKPAAAAEPQRFAPGRILVQPRTGLPQRDFDSRLASVGGRRARVIGPIGVHVVQVPVGRELAAVQALENNPHIVFAEVDALHAPVADPGLPNQWYVPTIGADRAWTAGGTGAGVTLAVCDSGVSSTHQDLAGRLVLPGYNAVDGTTNSEPLHGHGTWVAGTIGMTGGNDFGGKGVAFAGMILPVRVSNLSDGSAYISDIASCITYAADHGARGANASYGVCGSSAIVSAANYMRSRNGVVTISAGNSGTDPGYAANSAITCVSATDGNDAITSWSSFGAFVDVAAPGSSIYTTDMGGAYAYVSGTSFSAPITLGVYGEMMAANPALTPTQLDQILFATAKDLGAAGLDNYYGNGRIDAAAAVSRAIATTVSDTTNPTASFTSPSAGAKVKGLLPVDVAASDNVAVTRVILRSGSTVIGTIDGPASPYRFTVDTTAFPDGPLSLAAEADDAAGNFGLASLTVGVANDAIAPVVQFVNPVGGATVTGTVGVSVGATDNRNQLAQVTLAMDGRQVATGTASTLSYSWKVCPVAKKCSGTSTLTATATDIAGNKGTASITVTKSPK